MKFFFLRDDYKMFLLVIHSTLYLNQKWSKYFITHGDLQSLMDGFFVKSIKRLKNGA